MTTPRPIHARLRATVLATAGIALAVVACEVPRPTELAPEHTIPLADVRSGEGFTPSVKATIEQVRTAIARSMPAEQRDQRTGTAQEIWLVADASGKLLRTEIKRRPESEFGLSGSPATTSWSDSGARVAVRRPKVAGAGGAALTAALAPESIESIEVLKLAPGVVTADSANVVWVRLKEGASLDASAAVATSIGSGTVRRPGTPGAPPTASAESVPRLRVLGDSGSAPTPLFVVDGQEVEAPVPLGDDPNFPVPRDSIASVDVLKGAAATKAYGSRGANGVIVITTKRKP